MRAAVLQGWGLPLALTDVPRPVPGPGELLVRVRSTGVCHSDVHLWKGDWPAKREQMERTGVRILGHEGIGTVAEIGAGVLAYTGGGRVGVPWMNSWCGTCENCLTGYVHWCPRSTATSVSVNGTYARHTTISERAAVRIPEGISDRDAAPLLCAGVTAYGALRRLTTELRIPPGKWIGIVGAAGGLGHYAVQMAHAMGYRVVGIDVGEERVEFVRLLGADRSVAAGSAIALAKDLGGLAAALVFTPTIDGYGLGRRLLAPTGALVAVGIPNPSEGPWDLSPADLIANGPRIIPSSVGVTHEFQAVFDLFRDGRIQSHVPRTGELSDVSRILSEMVEARYLGRAVVTI
jgi:alcohol dehydrogenase, propanol-preferring